jgi:hypothetical protein
LRRLTVFDGGAKTFWEGSPFLTVIKGFMTLNERVYMWVFDMAPVNSNPNAESIL